MFNPENSRFYLICVGRQEAFRSNLSIQFLFKAVAFLRYDPTDSYKESSPRGFMMKGSIWNLTRVILNLMSLSMFVLVPMFYLAIFKFRRNQVDTMPGMLVENQIIWDFWSRCQRDWAPKEERKQLFHQQGHLHCLADRGIMWNMDHSRICFPSIGIGDTFKQDHLKINVAPVFKQSS